MDVTTFLRRGAENNRSREAIVFGDQRLTFSQVWNRATALARGLHSLGLHHQDHVAVLENNNIASVDAFVGLAVGGYVRVPLYARNASSGHESMLRQAGCKAVMVGPDYVHELAEIRERLPGLEHIIVTDTVYEDWLVEHAGSDPQIAIADSDLFQIRFTGGTTGAPKGVPATHAQFMSQVADWFITFPYPVAEDAVLHAAPITHASGSMLLPLWGVGGRNVLLSEFDPQLVLDAFETEDVAYLFLPPTAINVLTRQPDIESRDLSRLKVLMSAAAPITEDTTLRARACFGDVLYQGYGLSECFPLTMMSSSEWFAKPQGSEPLRACGKTLPFARIEIWDADNQLVPTGEAGEIVAQCAGQMSGYWQAPEETAATIVDGWVKTGDIGRFDDNGYLYVLDRKKDLVISGGFNLYPAEIENVLATLPGVEDVAVIGVPDEKWGESPVAVVVSQGNVTEQAVMDLVVRELGSYKKLKSVVIQREPLPKTPVGKTDKKAIRAPYWESEQRGISGA